MSDGAPFDDLGRKNPSPGVHVQLGGPNWVLLTVTTQRRQTWLASAEVHRFIHQTWFEATAWLVSDYLLMPDHLHCFCAPRDLEFTIEQWIKYWKGEFRRKHGQADWKFQSRGWHHIDCAMAKAMPRSGSTCRKTQSGKDWSRTSKSGHTKDACMTFDGADPG